MRSFEDISKYKPLGKVVWSKTIKIKGSTSERVQTPIDLSEAFADKKYGLAMLALQFDNYSGDYDRKEVIWIQSSPIGLDIVSGRDSAYCLVNELVSGVPVAGAEVRLGEQSVKTDKNGLAILKRDKDKDYSEEYITASSKGCKVFYPAIANRIFGPNGRDTIGCRWSVFDDRGLYRPNESVHVKGWVRTLEDKPDKNCVLDPRLKEVVWTVKDPRNNKICDGKTAINEYGGFEFDFTLPDNMNLGNASINIACNDVPSLANRSTTHYFDVQEFRRPEFEVSSKVEGTDHLMNERAFVSAEAKYFAGGKLSDADIKWTANANRSSYSPPGWSEYTFGKWSPWWHCWWWPEEKSTAVSHTFSSKTDSLGKNVLQLDLGQNSPPTPVSISVSAAVSDVNRQTWSASSSFLVHPSELYVGVKTDRYYYSEGAEAEYNVVVTDIEGKAKAGVPVSIRWARIEDHFEDGKLIEKEIESFNDNFTSTAEASLRKLKFPKAGSWRLNAEVKDSKGRPNITTMRMWIGDCAAPQNTSVNVEEITLVPDKKEYKVGETAEILVQLPFTARQLTYTIARSGIAKSETISMQGDSTTLKIPLDKEWTPSVNLRVMAAGEAQRYDNAGKPIKDSLRPACAKGDLNLSIPAVEKSLKVEVLPAKQNLEPAGKTDIIVKVKDNSGKPVDDAEVALVVVDESVWALAGYNISDPLGNFYHARNQDVSQYLLRSMMVLQEQRIPKQASNREMEVQRGAMGGALNYAGAPRMVYKSVVRSEMTMDECVPMAECDAALADDEGGQDNGKPINVRTNFDALALFKGHLQTDKQGQVKVEVTLPDNLTRYRVVAVVADKDSRFGKGESSLTARLPLMVRPNAPRFLNFGDIVEVPVILHNQTERDLRTEVVYRASNLSIDNQGIVCLVPANTRREVRIPAKVKEVGEAQVQVAAVSGNYADSSLMKMPVYTPCTTEAFATYGSIESDKTLVQPIKAPKDAYKQFGGLEVSTSSTALQELVDAVLYLCNYPFACSEQLASRIIVTSNMYDVLSEFNVKELPKSEDVKRQINEDIKTMCSRQNSRGLFGLWEADDHNLPYVTVHCAQSLVIAKDKGYNVPQNKYNAALEALKNIDRYIDKKLYSEESRLVINTYAENVLWQVGKHDPKRLADRLSKFKMEEVPIEVLGWALPVLRDTHADLANEIRRVIANKTSETASTANVGNTREKDGYLIMDSDMRSEAVLLSGLITDNAKNSVIPKLVKTLLSGRKHGHWGNTQSNSMVVMALYKYFKTYEAVTPDFIANAWLGEDYVGQYKFKGRQTHYLESFIPMQQVGDESKLILDKKGPGRLYYRLGLSYASKDLNPKPYEGGFTVERVYEGVDDPKDVKQLADGTWKIKLGSRVRCKVKLVAPSRRAHVALTVPLPAGCEILNGAFKMTESVPTDNASKARQSYCWWWWDRPWYDHENLRDERAEAFSLVLYGGDYDYSFVCRATVPGKFIVPPAKAEEMYSPETFGRSGGAKVVIE
ncbi:hypothetical protein IJT10_06750 [bacterium]|nr:hypothetical protein [bacterium]